MLYRYYAMWFSLHVTVTKKKKMQKCLNVVLTTDFPLLEVVYPHQLRTQFSDILIKKTWLH